MYFIRRFLLLLISILTVNSIQVVSSNLGLQIKDFHITQCDTKAKYEITLENINIRIGVNPKVFVSGIFTTEVDLVTPVKAVLEIWHKVIFWVKLPCEAGKGSCTYEDLCKYSVPENKSCPPYLDQNNVPCRCPIIKGKYTIPAKVSFPPLESIPLVDGTYKGTINIYANSSPLACYDFDFVLVDELHRLKNEYFNYNHQHNYL